MDAIETIESFAIEIKQDLELDEIDLREKQMLLPSIRHKWVGRLIRAKYDRAKTEKQRKRTIASLMKTAENLVAGSNRSKFESVKASDPVRLLDEQLIQYDLLIEYLDRVTDICTKVGFDVKNLLEIIRLETT